MNEREIRIQLYGAIGQEAADESEYVARHEPEIGRQWFTSIDQARMVTRCALLAAPRTEEILA